jgi:hypothetical protein
MIKLKDQEIRRYIKYAVTLNYWDKKEVLQSVLDRMFADKRFFNIEDLWREIRNQLAGKKSNYKGNVDLRIVSRYLSKLEMNAIRKMQAPFEPIDLRPSLLKNDLKMTIESIITRRRLS